MGDAFSKSLSIVPRVTYDRSWRQFRIYIKFHLVAHNIAAYLCPIQ